MSIAIVEGAGYTGETHIDPAPSVLTSGAKGGYPAPLSSEIGGTITLQALAVIGTGDPQAGQAPAIAGVGGGVPLSIAPLSTEVGGTVARPAPLEIEVGQLGVADPAPLVMQVGQRGRAPAPLSGTISGQSRTFAPNAITVSRPSPGDPAPSALETTSPATGIAPATEGIGGHEDGQAPASLESQAGESVTIIVDIASEVIAGARGDNCP
jgi:hypothetical protein